MTAVNVQSEEISVSAFADMDLRPELMRSLVALGYEEPTPIQRESIPLLIAGNDLLGQAATGTGKTAAFALPILEQLARGKRSPEPSALVLVPTRELAMQVCEAVNRYGQMLNARALAVYGGQSIGIQLGALKRGVDVVVATPGRALDHIKRGSMSLERLNMVVLDEADEMLDMGFAEDLDEILGATPEDRQTVLFSATMPKRVEVIAQRHLRLPARVTIERPVVKEGELPLVSQTAYIVNRAQKPAALARMVAMESPESALVFCRTRDQVDQLTDLLNGRGYRAEALHGGMNQEQRDRVMGRLRSKTAALLIATDVAARGLDIDHLTHVFNYDLPNAAESYVHRIGRVGRAGRNGVAITLAEPKERHVLKTVERVTKRPINIEKIPTVAQLKARQLEKLTGELRASVESKDLEAYRSVIESLTADLDPTLVAMAALERASTVSTTGDDTEIPEPFERNDRNGDRKGRSFSSGPKSAGKFSASGPMKRIFVGAGRSTGVRPQDLVGAIAGESRLGSKDIGAIQISNKFSLVEVPSTAADDVIKALRNTSIRGKKTIVRHERPDHN